MVKAAIYAYPAIISILLARPEASKAGALTKQPIVPRPAA